MVVDKRLRKWVNFLFFVLGFCLVFALSSAFARSWPAAGSGETTSPLVRDQVLLAAVETGLKLNPDLSGYPLSVSAQNSVITLTGSVPSTSLRVMALEVAARTSGVRGVVSRIEIDPRLKPKPSSMDHPRAQQPASRRAPGPLMNEQ